MLHNKITKRAQVITAWRVINMKKIRSENKKKM